MAALLEEDTLTRSIAPTGRRPRLPIDLPLPEIPETVVPNTVLPTSRHAEDNAAARSGLQALSDAAPLSGTESFVSDVDPLDLTDDDLALGDAPWENGLQRLTRRAKRFFTRGRAA